MALGDKVFLADKETLDTVNRNLSDVHSRVGTTTDTGGTATAGTLFGKINAIISSIAAHVASWTAARAAKIDTIDTNAAAASAQTAANHTANATGTLSQKLSHIISLVAGISTSMPSNAPKYRKSYSASISPSANVAATVINVSGAGTFHGMVSNISHNMSAITVEIDGVTITPAGSAAWALFRSKRYPHSLLAWGTIDEMRDWGIPLEFRRSLKITATYRSVVGNDSSNGYVYAAYDLYE